MRAVLIFLVALALAGCATTVSQLSPEEKAAIQETAFKAKYKDTFRAVMEVFQDRGYSLDNTDVDVGLISTDWRESSSVGEVIFGEVRSKMNATITEIDSVRTKVRLHGIVQNQSFGGWQTVDLNKDQATKQYGEYFKLIAKKLGIAE